MKIVWPLFAPLLSSLVLLAGCGTAIERTKLNAPPHPLMKRPASSVEIFMRQAPERPFVEVWMIEAQQESGFSADSQSDIMAKMREAAGDAGCDGLFINGANDKTVVSGGGINGSGSVSSTTLKGYRATCIVYR